MPLPSTDRYLVKSVLLVKDWFQVLVFRHDEKKLVQEIWLVVDHSQMKPTAEQKHTP